MKKKLRVDIWSDIACPWCFVGKRRFEAALARFEHRDEVEVVWRAFELDPSAPPRVDSKLSHVERIAKKYGIPVDVAEARTAQLTESAAGEGLAFRFDRIQSGNTFDAHRLVHLGHERGLQDAVKERFLRGYLEEGAAIGDGETIAKLAVEAGLDADAVAGVLSSDAFAAEVRADESEAREAGIRGVPFFVIGRYAVSGAQPPEILLRALGLAWSELEPARVAFAEGAVCGPDGCA